MLKEVKRYKLADISKEELVEKLKKLDFKKGSWQNKYKDKNVMSKCFPLCKSIEVHITIDIDKLNFNDSDDVLVLDDDFCQAYTPFYNYEKLNTSFAFLFNVVKAYNRVMDILVSAGVLINQEYSIEINSLVRDKVVTQMEAEGYDCIYHKTENINEIISLLTQKLIQSAKDFEKNVIAEDMADMLECIDALRRISGLYKDGLEIVKEDKKKLRGSYEDYVYLERAIMK